MHTGEGDIVIQMGTGKHLKRRRVMMRGSRGGKIRFAHELHISYIIVSNNYISMHLPTYHFSALAQRLGARSGWLLCCCVCMELLIRPHEK